MTSKSGYSAAGALKVISRFAHLALGAREEDEDEEKARAEESPKDEDDEDASEDEEKKGKKAKKARAEDQDDDDEEARAEEEDEGEDEDEDKRDRKAAAQARADERARWAAVMSSHEAKGRVALACSLLADTSMNAQKIRAALLVSPVEARQGLAARMAAVPRPDVGSAAAATPPDMSTAKGRAAVMMAAYDKAVGR